MALEELTIYNFTPDEIWMEQFVVAVCRSKKTESNRVKYWEASLTTSAKPGGVGAASQRLIPTDEQSGLQTHIATRESASLCVQMISSLPFWSWKGRFVCTYLSEQI